MKYGIPVVPVGYGSHLRDGFVCRTPFLASTEAGGANVAHVEVATPLASEFDGLLLCLTTEGATFDRASTSLDYFAVGGSQFENTTDVVASARTGLDDLGALSFFQAATGTYLHDPAELVAPADVLAHDAYYRDKANYHVFLLDNLVADANGASLLTLPRARASDYAAESRTGFANATEGSCLLLTGRWQKGERYDLRIGFTNPPGVGDEVGLWAAPVGYTLLTEAEGTNMTDRRVKYTVRGDKRGQVCALRDGMQATLTAAAGDPMAGVVPATSCTGTAVLSTRVAGYGECVECQELDFFGEPVASGQAGAVAASGAGCACPATHTALPVGTRACGPQRGPPAAGETAEWQALQEAVSSKSGTAWATVIDPATVTADSELPGMLCSVLAQAWEDLKLTTESDAASREYAAIFASLVSPLLDAAGFIAANETVALRRAWDPRNVNLALPTREFGVLPRCSSASCTTGRYKGMVSGTWQTLMDRRYDSARTFRTIGTIIADLSSSECSRIWSSSDDEWLPSDYFPADNICRAL